MLSKVLRKQIYKIIHGGLYIYIHIYIYHWWWCFPASLPKRSSHICIYIQFVEKNLPKHKTIYIYIYMYVYWLYINKWIEAQAYTTCTGYIININIHRNSIYIYIYVYIYIIQHKSGIRICFRDTHTQTLLSVIYKYIHTLYTYILLLLLLFLLL